MQMCGNATHENFKRYKSNGFELFDWDYTMCYLRTILLWILYININVETAGEDEQLKTILINVLRCTLCNRIAK